MRASWILAAFIFAILSSTLIQASIDLNLTTLNLCLNKSAAWLMDYCSLESSCLRYTWERSLQLILLREGGYLGDNETKEFLDAITSDVVGGRSPREWSGETSRYYYRHDFSISDIIETPEVFRVSISERAAFSNRDIALSAIALLRYGNESQRDLARIELEALIDRLRRGRSERMDEIWYTQNSYLDTSLAILSLMEINATRNSDLCSRISRNMIDLIQSRGGSGIRRSCEDLLALAILKGTFGLGIKQDIFNQSFDAVMTRYDMLTSGDKALLLLAGLWGGRNKSELDRIALDLVESQEPSGYWSDARTTLFCFWALSEYRERIIYSGFLNASRILVILGDHRTSERDRETVDRFLGWLRKDAMEFSIMNYSKALEINISSYDLVLSIGGPAVNNLTRRILLRDPVNFGARYPRYPNSLILLTFWNGTRCIVSYGFDWRGTAIATASLKNLRGLSGRWFVAWQPQSIWKGKRLKEILSPGRLFRPL